MEGVQLVIAICENYSFRKNRNKNAYRTNVEVAENGDLIAGADFDEHAVFFEALDSAETETEWGRLTMKLQCPENVIVRVHLIASDRNLFTRNGGQIGSIDDFLLSSEEPEEIKRKIFDQNGEQVFTNQENILLYDLHGRYLWIYLEIIGKAEVRISNMRVVLPGDNFMNTFPEIYRQNGDFMKRYLSVFSSIYNDFQDRIDQVSDLLDFDTAPAYLLPVFASWLGVDVRGDFLSEQELRCLVKEIYQFNRMKGTREVLERITEIVLGEKVIIVEKNLVHKSDLAQYHLKDQPELYGNSPYDVTLFVRNFVEEKKRSQLFFLLHQFVPVRCRLHILYLDLKSTLDTYCYLDMNAATYQTKEAGLDQVLYLNDNVVMQ